jgi:transcriptional regulator with XRE-family HTH domain
VLSASLLVQARRQAGLSQRELAARASVAQQEIARYERGRVTPSLERLRALIAACGLELTVGLARADHSYDHQIAAALELRPEQRLDRALLDVPGVLTALRRADVQYVLIGELAEALHGSPLLPVTDTVTIVPRAGERERLSVAISGLGGKPVATSTTSAIDRPARFMLEHSGTELVIEPAPPGTHGYDDLRRDAAAIRLDEDLEVIVASLVDLIRIAEASDDRARVPPLRRTLVERGRGRM